MLEDIQNYDKWSESNPDLDLTTSLSNYTDYLRIKHFRAGAKLDEESLKTDIAAKLAIGGAVDPEAPAEEIDTITSQIMGPTPVSKDADAQFLLDHYDLDYSRKTPEQEEKAGVLRNYFAMKKFNPSALPEVQDLVDNYVSDAKAVREARIAAVDRGDLKVVAVDHEDGRQVYTGRDFSDKTIRDEAESLISAGAISAADLDQVDNLTRPINGGLSTVARGTRQQIALSTIDELVKKDKDLGEMLQNDINKARRSGEFGNMSFGEKMWDGFKQVVVTPFEVVSTAVSDAVRGPQKKKVSEHASLLDRQILPAGSYSEEETRNYIKDYILHGAGPAYRADRPSTGITLDSEKNPVLSAALVPNKAQFEAAIKESPLNEEQKQYAGRLREAQLETQAPLMKDLILRNESSAVSQYAQAKAAGMTDAQFVEGWVGANDKNYSGMLERTEQIGVSTLSAIAGLPLGVFALAGNESATKAMVAMQKNQSSREEYSRLMGDEYGLGFQILNTVPQVAVDVLATAGTLGAYTAVKGSVRSAARSLVKTLVAKLGTEAASSLRAAATVGGESLVDKAVTNVGKDLALQLNVVERSVPLFASAFTRQAGSVYGSIYSQLPDNMSHEDKHKNAVGYAVAAGLGTAISTVGLSVLGHGGIDDLATGKFRPMSSADEIAGAGQRKVSVWDLNYKQAKLLYQDLHNAGQLIADSAFQKAIRASVGGAYKNYFREVSKNFVDEGLQETVDQAIQMKLEEAALDKKLPLSARLDQLWNSFLVGGALSGATSSVSQLVMPMKASDYVMALEAKATAFGDIAKRLRETGSNATAEIVERRLNGARAEYESRKQAEVAAQQQKAAMKATELSVDANEQAVFAQPEGEVPEGTMFTDLVGEKVDYQGFSGVLEKTEDGSVYLKFNKPLSTGETHIYVGTHLDKATGVVNKYPRVFKTASDYNGFPAGTPFVSREKQKFALPSLQSGPEVRDKIEVQYDEEGNVNGLMFIDAPLMKNPKIKTNIIARDAYQIAALAKHYGIDLSSKTEPAIDSEPDVVVGEAAPEDTAPKAPTKYKEKSYVGEQGQLGFSFLGKGKGPALPLAHPDLEKDATAKPTPVPDGEGQMILEDDVQRMEREDGELKLKLIADRDAVKAKIAKHKARAVDPDQKKASAAIMRNLKAELAEAELLIKDFTPRDPNAIRVSGETSAPTDVEIVMTPEQQVAYDSALTSVDAGVVAQQLLSIKPKAPFGLFRTTFEDLVREDWETSNADESKRTTPLFDAVEDIAHNLIRVATDEANNFTPEQANVMLKQAETILFRANVAKEMFIDSEHYRNIQEVNNSFNRLIAGFEAALPHLVKSTAVVGTEKVDPRSYVGTTVPITRLRLSNSSFSKRDARVIRFNPENMTFDVEFPFGDAIRGGVVDAVHIDPAITPDMVHSPVTSVTDEDTSESTEPSLGRRIKLVTQDEKGWRTVIVAGVYPDGIRIGISEPMGPVELADFNTSEMTMVPVNDTVQSRVFALTGMDLVTEMQIFGVVGSPEVVSVGMDYMYDRLRRNYDLPARNLDDEVSDYMHLVAGFQRDFRDAMRRLESTKNSFDNSRRKAERDKAIGDTLKKSTALVNEIGRPLRDRLLVANELSDEVRSKYLAQITGITESYRVETNKRSRVWTKDAALKLRSGKSFRMGETRFRHAKEEELFNYMVANGHIEDLSGFAESRPDFAYTMTTDMGPMTYPAFSQSRTDLVHDGGRYSDPRAYVADKNAYLRKKVLELYPQIGEEVVATKTQTSRKDGKLSKRETVTSRKYVVDGVEYNTVSSKHLTGVHFPVSEELYGGRQVLRGVFTNNPIITKAQMLAGLYVVVPTKFGIKGKLNPSHILSGSEVVALRQPMTEAKLTTNGTPNKRASLVERDSYDYENSVKAAKDNLFINNMVPLESDTEEGKDKFFGRKLNDAVNRIREKYTGILVSAANALDPRSPWNSEEQSNVIQDVSVDHQTRLNRFKLAQHVARRVTKELNKKQGNEAMERFVSNLTNDEGQRATVADLSSTDRKMLMAFAEGPKFHRIGETNLSGYVMEMMDKGVTIDQVARDISTAMPELKKGSPEATVSEFARHLFINAVTETGAYRNLPFAGDYWTDRAFNRSRDRRAKAEHKTEHLISLDTSGEDMFGSFSNAAGQGEEDVFEQIKEGIRTRQSLLQGELREEELLNMGELRYEAGNVGSIVSERSDLLAAELYKTVKENKMLESALRGIAARISPEIADTSGDQLVALLSSRLWSDYELGIAEGRDLLDKLQAGKEPEGMKAARALVLSGWLPPSKLYHGRFDVRLGMMTPSEVGKVPARDTTGMTDKQVVDRAARVRKAVELGRSDQQYSVESEIDYQRLYDEALFNTMGDNMEVTRTVNRVEAGVERARAETHAAWSDLNAILGLSDEVNLSNPQAVARTAKENLLAAKQIQLEALEKEVSDFGPRIDLTKDQLMNFLTYQNELTAMRKQITETTDAAKVEKLKLRYDQRRKQTHDIALYSPRHLDRLTQLQTEAQERLELLRENISTIQSVDFSSTLGSLLVRIQSASEADSELRGYLGKLGPLAEQKVERELATLRDFTSLPEWRQLMHQARKAPDVIMKRGGPVTAEERTIMANQEKADSIRERRENVQKGLIKLRDKLASSGLTLEGGRLSDEYAPLTKIKKTKTKPKPVEEQPPIQKVETNWDRYLVKSQEQVIADAEQSRKLAAEHNKAKAKAQIETYAQAVERKFYENNTAEYRTQRAELLEQMAKEKDLMESQGIDLDQWAALNRGPFLDSFSETFAAGTEATQPQKGRTKLTDLLYDLSVLDAQYDRATTTVEQTNKEQEIAAAKRMGRPDGMAPKKGRVRGLNRSLGGVSPELRDEAVKVNTAEATRLGLISGNSGSVVNALTRIAKEGSPMQRRVATLLLSAPEMVRGTNFLMAEMDTNSAGVYDSGTNTVIVNLADHNGRGLSDVILHELVHAATVQMLTNPVTAAQRAAVTRITQLRLLTQKLAAARGPVDTVTALGLKNNKEFLSYALTAPEFSTLLRTLSPPNQRSLFSRVIDTILQFFGVDPMFKGRDSAQALDELFDFTKMSLSHQNTFNNNMVRTAALGDVASAEDVLHQAIADRASIKVQNYLDSVVERLEQGDESLLQAEATPVTTDPVATLKSMLPRGMTVVEDENMKRGMVHMSRRQPNAVRINPTVLRDTMSRYSPENAKALIRSAVDHELAHLASFTEFSEADFASIAASMTPAQLEAIAHEYYSSSASTYAERSAMIAQDRESGALLDSDLATEWVRQQITRTVLGTTSEEDIDRIRSIDGMFDKFINALLQFINKLRERYGITPTAETAARLSRASREFRRLRNGGILPSPEAATRGELGDSTAFLDKLDNLDVEGQEDRGAFMLPIAGVNKEKIAGFWKKVGEKLVNFPRLLKDLVDLRSGALALMEYNMEQFSRAFPKLRDNAMNSGFTLEEIGAVLGTTAPMANEQQRFAIRRQLVDFGLTLPKVPPLEDRVSKSQRKAHAELVAEREAKMDERERELYEVAGKETAAAFRVYQAEMELRLRNAGHDTLVDLMVETRAQMNNSKTTIGFDDSNDVYLTRTYRFFTTPAWMAAAKSGLVFTDSDGVTHDFGAMREEAAKLMYDDEVRYKATKEGEHLTEAQIHDRVMKKLDDYLENLTAQAEESRQFSGLKSVTNDINRLKSKKDFDADIRKLLGEVKDPRENAIRTIYNVGKMAANKKFIEEFSKQVVAMGLGQYSPAEGMDLLFGANAEARVGALAGLHVRKDLVGAMEELFGVYGQDRTGNAMALVNSVLRGASWFSSASIMAKTSLGFGYWVRNVLGGELLTMAQGLSPVSGNTVNSLKTAWQANMRFFNETDTGERDVIRRLVELQILRDDSRGRVAMDMMKGFVAGTDEQLDATFKAILEAQTSGDTKGIMGIAKTVWGYKGDAVQFLAELNNMVDSSFKVHAYFAELDNMKSNYGDTKPLEWLESAAARKVKLTFPTHSQSLDLTKSINRSPISLLFLPFLRWKTEVFRTMVNTPKLAWEEINSGNAGERVRGIRRIAGFSSVLGGGSYVFGSIISGIFAAIGKVGDDDDKLNDGDRELTTEEIAALREGLPEWQRQHGIRARIINGKLQIVDLTNVLPYSQLTDIARMLYEGVATGEGPDSKAIMKYIAHEWAGTNIAATSVTEMVQNRDDFGKPIWLPNDNMAEVFAKQLAHVTKALLPTGVAKIQQITRTGETNRLEMVLGEVTGTRPKIREMGDVLHTALNSIKQEQMDAVGYREALLGGRNLGLDEIAPAIDNYQSAMNASQLKMRNLILTMRSMGLSNREIYAQAKLVKISEDSVNQAAAGYRPAWRPNQAWRDKMFYNVIRAGEIEGDKSARKMAEERWAKTIEVIAHPSRPDVYYVGD